MKMDGGGPPPESNHSVSPPTRDQVARPLELSIKYGGCPLTPTSQLNHLNFIATEKRTLQNSPVQSALSTSVRDCDSSVSQDQTGESEGLWEERGEGQESPDR